jgi:hypothetical protein
MKTRNFDVQSPQRLRCQHEKKIPTKHGKIAGPEACIPNDLPLQG